MQFPQYALDSQVRVPVDERGHLGRAGPSCAAKNTEVIRRTSLARLTWALSLPSATSPARSSVLRPPVRSPASPEAAMSCQAA